MYGGPEIRLGQLELEGGVKTDVILANTKLEAP